MNDQLDSSDVDRLQGFIAQGQYDSQSDFNFDGAVDGFDLSFWLSDVKNTSLGDADLDGDVDAADRTAIISNWTGALVEMETIGWANGDFDADGDVDTADLTQLVTHWSGALQAHDVAIAGQSVVPEPSALILVFVALGFLVLQRR